MLPKSATDTVPPRVVFYNAVNGDDDARLTAISQANLGKLAPECHHSGFYWSSG